MTHRDDQSHVFVQTVERHIPAGTEADRPFLKLPQGKLLKYVHMGYGSTYERDLLLEVLSGVVVATTVRCNEGEAIDEDDDLPF